MAFTEKYRLAANPWLLVKMLLTALILLNGSLVLMPLVSEVSSIAQQSAATGHLLPNYAPIKAKEDMYGLANFLMLAIALVLVVYRPFSPRPAPVGRVSAA